MDNVKAGDLIEITHKRCFTSKAGRKISRTLGGELAEGLPTFFSPEVCTKTTIAKVFTEDNHYPRANFNFEVLAG